VSNEKQVRVWDVVPGYDFNDEVELATIPSWFLDGAHSIPPLTPMFGYQWARFCGHGLKYGCTVLSIPTCKGWELRILNGGVYVAFHIVRDEKEIAERDAKFRQALRPYIEDFDGRWNSQKQELLEICNKFKELDVDHATNIQLYYHNYDLMKAYQRMWEIHFIGMYTSFNAWLLLESMCKERFGMNDQAPEYQDMMRGFDNKVYQMDKKLWEFGQLATQMGLGQVFKENEPNAIISKLQQSEAGREWMKKFMDYMETDEIGGWRMRRFVDLNEPYWLEDPATPIGLVKDWIMRGVSYDLEAIRAEMAKKREAAIVSFLQRVPPQEKDLFEGLVRLAGKASMYSEEHDLYCELIVHAFMRRGYLAMGRRLAENGTIDAPDDIWMMNPDEIDRVMLVPDRHDMRWLTRRRRAAWEESLKTPNPPFFTKRASPQEAVVMDLLPSGDAIALKIVVGEMPVVKPELKADLWGLCGCAGEAEGTARVVVNYEDLKDVKPSEILICAATNPAWTPVYSLVKGVICDTGGTLQHAAIIGREYNIPTIVNTMKGTQMIKTGQRVRMDAANGAVYILG
jgi:pyruvate,water dikinase